MGTGTGDSDMALHPHSYEVSESDMEVMPTLDAARAAPLLIVDKADPWYSEDMHRQYLVSPMITRGFQMPYNNDETAKAAELYAEDANVTFTEYTQSEVSITACKTRDEIAAQLNILRNEKGAKDMRYFLNGGRDGGGYFSEFQWATESVMVESEAQWEKVDGLWCIIEQHNVYYPESLTDQFSEHYRRFHGEFDRNWDFFITKEELVNLVDDEETAAAMIADADIDDNGKISFGEFLKMMTQE